MAATCVLFRGAANVRLEGNKAAAYIAGCMAMGFANFGHMDPNQDIEVM